MNWRLFAIGHGHIHMPVHVVMNVFTIVDVVTYGSTVDDIVCLWLFFLTKKRSITQIIKEMHLLWLLRNQIVIVYMRIIFFFRIVFGLEIRNLNWTINKLSSSIALFVPDCIALLETRNATLVMLHAQCSILKAERNKMAQIIIKWIYFILIDILNSLS